MFYTIGIREVGVKPESSGLAALMQAPAAMAAPAPGHCISCGADAYIQLAAPGGMLCAHCYAERTTTAPASAPTNSQPVAGDTRRA